MRTNTKRKPAPAPAKAAIAAMTAMPAEGEALERRRKRDEFARQKAASDRARAEARQQLFTAFKMWTICPDKRCKRAKACADNAERCMKERWHPAAPPELKALLQKFFAYTADGYTQAEAMRLAHADVQRHIAAAQRVDAQYPQVARTPVPAPNPSPQPPAPPRMQEPWHGPRIRFP